MTKALLPQAFWFRAALSCPRLEEMPRAGAGGDSAKRLLDLPTHCALPDWSGLEGGGRSSWASVRLAWNPRGLGVAVEARGLNKVQLDPSRPEGLAQVFVWLDTRDTRDISRASRFCHGFVAHLKMASRGPGAKPLCEVTSRPIARATAEPPRARAGLVQSHAELTPGRDGWLLEIFFPAEVLNGFDPETNRRLGFAYQASEHVREDQFFGVGRDFPIGENPSLWATLELKD